MRATLAFMAAFVAALLVGAHFGYGAEQKFEQKVCDAGLCYTAPDNP